MRILFIAPYPPAHDGIGIYSHLLCAEINRQGHEVKVIVARRSGPAPPEVVGVMPGPLQSIEPALAAIDRVSPDIVHVQFAVSAYGARTRNLIRILERLRRQGRVVIVTMHEITRDLDSLGAAGVAAYRRVAHRADRVIVHTESAQELYGEAIGASPTCLVVAHPRAELPSATVTGSQLRERHGLGEERVVLAFGFIHPDKGISDLLLAAGRLRREGALGTATIVIAGEVRRRFGILRPFELRDQLYLRQLRRIIAEQGLADRVLFTGYVPSGEVRGWFDVASVAVLPYHRIEQSGAGSLARAAGTPLLTTTVGELEQLGTFPAVPPGDPARLAKGLADALQVDGRRELPDEQPTDLEDIVAATTTVYEQIAKPARSAA